MDDLQGSGEAGTGRDGGPVSADLETEGLSVTGDLMAILRQWAGSAGRCGVGPQGAGAGRGHAQAKPS